MYRFVASIIVLVAVAVCWLLFGDHTPSNGQSSQPSSSSQPASPSADDEALRKSLGNK